MIDSDKVITAYRVVLGREPENDAVLDLMCRQPSLEALSFKLFASEEFRRRIALGELPASSQKWVCAEIRHGLRLWIDLMDQGVGAGALKDSWEQEETRFILSHLDSGSCFVDVGANIGWFTILAAHKVGPEGRVYAFEPRPDLFLRLRDSVSANDFRGRCFLKNFALGLEDGELPLASVPEEYNPGHSYLVRGQVDSGAVVLATVPIHRLDDCGLERKVDLLKIDVEGAEAMVIGGAQELLKRDKPFIISEFSPSWLRSVSGVEPKYYLDHLRSYGYRIFELNSGGIGNEIDDLPADSDRQGFYTNIVASAERKPFRVLTNEAAAVVSLPIATVVDESPLGIRADVQNLALNTRANYVHFNRILAQSTSNIERINDDMIHVKERLSDFGGWHEDAERKLDQRIRDIDSYRKEVEEKLGHLLDGIERRLNQRLGNIEKDHADAEHKVYQRIDDLGGWQQEVDSRQREEAERLYRRLDDIGGRLRDSEGNLRLKLKVIDARQTTAERYIRKSREINTQFSAYLFDHSREYYVGSIPRLVMRIFGKKRKEDRQTSDTTRIVAASTFFERQWYLDRYSDVHLAGLDPARHYAESGWRERRDPGPDFSTEWYLTSNSDLAVAEINPLWHYETGGMAEGRIVKSVAFVEEMRIVAGSSYFDRKWYVDTYTDVAELGADPVRHYCEFGWQESRDPGPSFSTHWYLEEHKDVATATVNPLWHYEIRGKEEGRRIKSVAFVDQTRIVATSSLFDSAWYCRTYLDLANAGVDPVQHYCEFGWLEGRDPGADFSSNWYREENQDIAIAGINPLWHYETNGKTEGRCIRPSGFVRTPESIEDIQRLRETVPCLAGAVGPVVMLIDDRLPEADRDSGSLDAVNMIESFIEFGYHVIVAVESTRRQEPKYEDQLRQLGAHPMTEKDAVNIQRFVEQYGRHIDLFVLSRVNAGGQYLELIRYNCPDAKIVFNTVDLHYVREERSARLSGDADALANAQRTRDREELIIGRSDLTLLVSSVEEEIMQASVPGCRTAVVPLARQINPPRTPFAKRSGIGFVGGFEHHPNIDAIRYFLAEVWPKVYNANPEIHFDIVGSALPADTLDSVVGNVRYLGPLDSLNEWFDSLRMTVAPLRIGAGAKGKVASSLCAGVPCVLSSVAAEGMSLIDGANVMLADNASAMAEKIVSLYDCHETWESISVGALEFAQERLSVSNYKRVLRAGIAGIEMPVY